MASAPRWKVYTAENKYRGACVEVEGAAALVSLYGDGATIRDGHPRKQIVWTDGVDGSAGDSYDSVALKVYERRGFVRKKGER